MPTHGQHHILQTCVHHHVVCADLSVCILACFQGRSANALLEGWWEQAPNKSQDVSHCFGLSSSPGLQQGLQHLMKKRKVLADCLASCTGSCTGVITCQINGSKGRRGTQEGEEEEEGEGEEDEEEVDEERKTERRVRMRMRSRKVHMQAAHWVYIVALADRQQDKSKR